MRNPCLYLMCVVVDVDSQECLSGKPQEENCKPFLCEECDRILKSKRNLEDHIRKIHRTCKHWAEIFENAGQLEHHKKEHTTCAICNVDMRTKYKLERHMNTHKKLLHFIRFLCIIWLCNKDHKDYFCLFVFIDRLITKLGLHTNEKIILKQRSVLG